MPELLAPKLRYRILRRQGVLNFADGFETTGPTGLCWHSLGTEAGTDNSIAYWTVDAGVPTYAAHVATMPISSRMRGGHADWTDLTFACVFTWITGSKPGIEAHADSGANAVLAWTDGLSIFLAKEVGGVYTQVGTIALGLGLTTGAAYTLVLTCVGTQYTAQVYYQSTSIGISTFPGNGSLQAPVTGVIADAALQSGRVGILNGPTGVAAPTGVPTFSLAATRMCVVYAPIPSSWAPTVIAGEPAFCLSKVGPQSGVYSASISSAAAAGSGAWDQPLPCQGGIGTISGWGKTSAGTANITAGGQITGNAGAAWTALTVTGALTKWPLLRCQLSGAVATAYFDRVAVTGSVGPEITTELDHPHRSTWTVRAMTPASPASNAFGSFTIPLFPVGTERAKANAATYMQLLPGLAEGLRVEAYRGDVLGGAPLFAGIITGSNIDTLAGTWTLTGFTDTWVAHAQRFFPGEVSSTAAGATNSIDRFKRYLGENILSFCDQFNPYVAGNYTVLGPATFVTGTDPNGINPNVVVASGTAGQTGSIKSKLGAIAGDGDNSHYAEVLVRFKPSSTSLVSVGIGLVGAVSGSIIMNCNVQFNATTGRWDLWMPVFFGASNSVALSSIEDADGWVSLTMGLLTNAYLTRGTVNGQVVYQGGSGANIGLVSDFNPGTDPVYAIIQYGAGTPAITAYFTNLVHGTRRTAQFTPLSAPFVAGTTDAPVHSIAGRQAMPATMLDGWSMIGQLETMFWRYTPSVMGVGIHPTMGKVDMQASPGTDLTAQVRFENGGNLAGVQMLGNADTFGSDLQQNGGATAAQGGQALARNLPAMISFGWLSDVGMNLSTTEYNAFRQQAQAQVNAKGSPGGSVVAKVNRDPATADQFRELDIVTVHYPEVGLNNARMTVLAYTYTEGEATQTLTLGQFSANDANYAAKRAVPNAALMAGLFKSR